MKVMNHLSMTAKGRIIALFALLIGFVCSCAPSIPPELEKVMTSQFVSEDVFLTITNGSSLAEVSKTLGSAVRHQFTVSEDGHRWTLIRCFLHTGEEEGYNFYQLLFRDNALVKTIGYVNWWKMEDIPYRGTTCSRVKPWDVEDMTGIRKVLDAPAVTHEQIRAELKDARKTMEKYKGQGNIPAVVGNLFAPAFIQKAMRDYPINEELRQRYDGCRTSLGMSVKEVDAIYGDPVHVFSTTTGRTARVYGDNRYLDVNPFLRFSFVAVLFDPDGQTADIYSDIFFCADWDPVLQQRKKADELE